MLELLAVTTEAEEALAGSAGHHVAPSAFGLGPGFFVALAMVVVLLIMWRAGLPRMIAGVLDKRIAEIRKQLDEAAKLREEAAALKAQYEERTREAERDAAAIKDAAEKQAEGIIAKAKDDATALIARRQAVSEAKIASAERAAVAEIRERAARAASTAAATLLAEKVDAKTDARLVDEAISGL